MKIRLTNITIIADVETEGVPDAPPVVVPPDQPPVVVPPAPADRPLPVGYDSDRSVGYYMLVSAMNAAGLTALSVQGKGPKIIAALKAMYPALDVYLSPSDAPVWPRWGSLDVTVDSGKGGWSFRVDGATQWKPAGQR